MDMPQGFVEAIQQHINMVNAATKAFDSTILCNHYERIMKEGGQR